MERLLNIHHSVTPNILNCEENQWWIQDFPDGGANLWVWSNNLFWKIFAENWTGGVRVPSASSDLPMRMNRRNIGGSKGVTLAHPPAPSMLKDFSISCIFSENLAKLNVGAPWRICAPCDVFCDEGSHPHPHHPYLWGECTDEVVWTRQEVDVQDDVTWRGERVTDARRGRPGVVVKKLVMWVSETEQFKFIRFCFVVRLTTPFLFI